MTTAIQKWSPGFLKRQNFRFVAGMDFCCSEMGNTPYSGIIATVVLDRLTREIVYTSQVKVDTVEEAKKKTIDVLNEIKFLFGEVVVRSEETHHSSTSVFSC